MLAILWPDFETQILLRVDNDSILPLHTLVTAGCQFQMKSREQVCKYKVHFGIGKTGCRKATLVGCTDEVTPVSALECVSKKPSPTYFFPMQSVLPFEKDRSQLFACLPSRPSHRSGSKLLGRSNMSGLLCRAKWLMPTTVPSGMVSLIAGT